MILLAACVAIGGLALVFRVNLLSEPATFDELYHLIAARGWLETGRLAILDGEYTRASGFTVAVGWLFEITGRETLATGRLLSVAAGALTPVALFLWLRAALEGPAAWGIGLIAAALAILWPQGIEESQTLRFYAWQVLAFTVGTIAMFQAVTTQDRARAGWSAAAVLALAIALYLQITTAFGLVAIAVWLVGALVSPLVLAHRHRWAILATAALLSLAALWLAEATGVLGEVWERYRWVAGHAEDRQNQVTYYHTILRQTYPTLWPLFAIAALIALRRRPYLASYCLVLFGVVLVSLSLGGMKAERYLSIGMPFFFAITAIALYELGPILGSVVSAAARQANPTRVSWLAPAAVGVALLFAALANPFVERSIDALRGQSAPSRLNPDWSSARALLGDWIDAPFRMTTNDLRAIVSLGDYDLLFNPSRLTELPGAGEFAEDFRTGRPVIGEFASFKAVLECHPDGLFLIDPYWWVRNRWGIHLTPLFVEAGREFEMRGNDDLMAIRWRGGEASPDACRRIPV